MFSRPYAGHDWTNAAALAQRGMKLDVVASSDFGDLDPYVSLFRTIHHLRHSKVLLVSRAEARPAAEGYAEQFGTTFAHPTYLDLKAAYEAVDAGKAARLADDFIQSAAKVVEPTRDEIVDSLRLYVALQEVMKKESANAIAIDCLGGFGRRELPAYPCVAFSKLNDAGLYGVCECDLESTMTQLLVTSFSGKPGFVSDPVFDTSRNDVIHAHCVSATRLQGIGGEASPYIVRSHLEDHKGVSMQVLAPGGDAVTVAKFADPNRLLVSTGEATGNVDNPRGCRTKIRTRVKDARKLLEGWSAALNTGPAMPGTRDLLHRVVFYGDHVESIERLGRLMGFDVIHEA
jgi:L-fucose isomerase-like protein